MGDMYDLAEIEHGLGEELKHILAGDAIKNVNKSDYDEEDFELSFHFHGEKTDDELIKELLPLIQ